MAKKAIKSQFTPITLEQKAKVKKQMLKTAEKGIDELLNRVLSIGDILQLNVNTEIK